MLREDVRQHFYSVIVMFGCLCWVYWDTSNYSYNSNLMLNVLQLLNKWMEMDRELNGNDVNVELDDYECEVE